MSDDVQDWRAVLAGTREWACVNSDCLDVLRELPAGSVDAVVTDPPYAEIDRPYGRLTEAEWHALIRPVVLDCQRALAPTGSAVYILQPNSERVGRMRPWLWEFMAWTTREVGMVQDAWWWNNAALPSGGANRYGLLRGSCKACVWLGPPDCYRNQAGVGLPIREASMRAMQLAAARKNGEVRVEYPCGGSKNATTMLATAMRRGWSTPFNVIATTHGSGRSDRTAGKHGHGAGTPFSLTEWWLRYIAPPASLVLDPFTGSGTTGVACLQTGRRFIGVEIDPTYHAVAVDRLTKAAAARQLALPVTETA